MAKKMVVALLVVLAVISVVVFLSRDEGGPIPSQASLANYGLAVWPEDTLEEAINECADAESWRSDARATARRFGREVLDYPEPGVGNPTPVRDHVRYLIGSRKLGRQRLFLGSILDLRRYGRCWYVVQGQPREDASLDATLGFVHHRGDTRLLISRPGGIPEVLIGYGTWDRAISEGADRVLIDMPPLAPDATGHVIYLAPDESGVSEYVLTERLGVMPSSNEGTIVRPLDAEEVVDNPKNCRIESSPYRSGKAVR